MAEAPHTLLVVDDNDENRDMLSRRLERRGYNVLSAEGGQAALDFLSEQSVDLILLDIMMPDVDGIEVLKRVRSRFDQDELPVIMATAKDDSEDIVEALDLGANDYVTKPIDFAVVMARVQKELRGLDRARSSRQVAQEAKSKAAEAIKAMPVGAGSVLENRYRLESIIGRGNFGTVYKAHHIEIDKPVAVKVLQTQAAENPEAVARFRTEGRAAVRVDHPNAVKVYDFGSTDNGTPYLAMELLVGEPLSNELARQQRLPLRRVLEILKPVCEVLGEAHSKGLVHRDIKPENIFLQSSRGGEVVKVLDFGIAKLAGDRINEQNLTAEGFVLGTPAYVAPERLQNKDYGGQSDVYSVGIMGFQMLAGSLPFKPNKDDPMAILMMHVQKEPPDLRDAAPGLPAAVYSAFSACLNKEPNDRPTAADLASTLDIILRHLPPDLEPPESAPMPIDAEDAGALDGPTHAMPTPSRGMLRRWLDKIRAPKP